MDTTKAAAVQIRDAESLAAAIARTEGRTREVLGLVLSAFYLGVEFGKVDQKEARP